MSLECPNCREPVSFLRSIRTTAWGSFSCVFCGSILGVSLARRLVAVGLMLAMVWAMSTVFRVQSYGMVVYIPVLTLVTLLCLYFCENVVLLERRSFVCKSCGYDLQGLTEHRCPECGTAFDPADRDRVEKRIGQPPPNASSRFARIAIVILIVASSIGVAAGFVLWRSGTGGNAPALPSVGTSPDVGSVEPAGSGS